MATRTTQLAAVSGWKYRYLEKARRRDFEMPGSTWYLQMHITGVSHLNA